METGRNRNEYFREMAAKEHLFAGSKPRKVSVSTMKAWLKVYRKEGFDGLMPKRRKDGGRPRRVGDKEMAAFNQRIALRHTMPPLAPDETVEYVEKHMKAASAPDPSFTPDALAAFHEISFGIPRRIGMVAEMALTLAMLDNKKSVDADLILRAKSLN